jgi:ABC-type sugar transport system substrate-binding protein
MQKVLFAVAGASALLAAGVASAQGLPPGTVPPVYGSVWSANQLNGLTLGAAATSPRSARMSDTVVPQAPARNVNLSPAPRDVRPGS